MHNQSLRNVSDSIHQHYTTVRSILNAYKHFGRTNKLLTFREKICILKQRILNQQRIRQRRAHQNHKKINSDEKEKEENCVA